MVKNKIKNKKTNNFFSIIMIRRLVIFGILSVFSIVYFFVTLFGYTYNYVSLKKEEKTLNENLVFLQEQKSSLKVEIQKLHNPEYIARYAKENYLYSSDGEYVLKIENTNDFSNNISKQNNNYYPIFIILFLISIILIVKRKKEKM